MNERYDVIIVGGGPGGAFLGYLLAKNDIRVLILEKKKVPRYKTCAGCLSLRAVKMLPFDIGGVVEDDSHHAVLFVNNRLVYAKSFDEPIAFMTMRSEFDALIIQEAVGMGASFRDETAFQSLYGSPGDLTVNTNKGILKAKLIVGADGMGGRVGRNLALKVKNHRMTAIQCEISFPSHEVIEGYKGSIIYDFGCVPRGCGWIFPKKKHLTVGLFSTAKIGRQLKRHLLNYIREKKIDAFSEIRRLRIHHIPYRVKKGSVFSNSKGMLVGDSLGAADPLTGEGIYYALAEAEIASKVIIQSIQFGYDHLLEYNRLIERNILNDLKYAQKMAFFVYGLPFFSQRAMIK